MSVNELDAKLSEITALVEDARRCEHANGLAHHDTRKHAGTVLRELRRWRESFTVNAEQVATVSNDIAVARGTATSRQPEQATKVVQSSSLERHGMAASPTLAIRLPPELLARVEQQADAEERTPSGVARRVLALHFGEHNRDRDHDQQQVVSA